MVQDGNPHGIPYERSARGHEERGATNLQACPICSHAMREHTIDHSTRNTIVNCPVPHPGAWDRDAFEPVNEFGMVIRRRRS